MNTQLPDENQGIQIGQVNYGQITDQSTQVQSEAAVKTWSGSAQETAPQFQQYAAPVMQSAQANTQPALQTFSTNAVVIPSIDIFGYIRKIIIIGITALPIILLVLSLILFLVENSFNIVAIGEYPKWITGKLESFVRTTILPLTE